MINEAILKIWIFLMHNWQNKVHASSIAVVVLRLSPNGRCGGVGGVVVRYVSPQELVLLLLSLFCPLRCFPCHPIYPGTHKIHVSLTEASTNPTGMGSTSLYHNIIFVSRKGRGVEPTPP